LLRNNAFSKRIKLHFFSVVQTVIEASGSSDRPFNIMFDEFAARISVYPIVFIISMIGYVWLCIKKPVFLLMLPILGIGFLSFSKGIRFSMYAIPSCAFGLAFVITRSTEIIKTFFDKNWEKYISTIFILIATSFALYPLINHAYNYKAGSVFVKDEVALLDDFKTKVNRDDYIITWWDYGYPLRYYADTKTLIDGGKHEGAENFPVSFILGNDQKSAANMARLDVEYTEKRFLIDKNNQNISSKDRVKIPSNNIAWMMKDYGFTNSNDFLLSLRTDINLPEKTRDIYFYLPYRMIDIFPTILRFSNRDLTTGDEFRFPFWLVSKNTQNSETTLTLEQGFIVNKQNGTFTTPQGQTHPLRRYVVSAINGDKVITQVQNINPAAQYSLIQLASYNIFLLVDEKMYNSVYIQMFYLENYDKELFELVSSNPYAKIYKLKI
jgi:dolichyl-diphosphooligosaccharide--protein glycosyltransferase/undecaprenyl-diphosphooligosaccharide--protein glycosyltransferase